MPLSLNRPSRFSPRAPRRAVRRTAALWLSDDRCVPITITNLSRAGFSAMADENLPPATNEFGVELPGLGIVRAELRWVEGREFGSQFEQPLTEGQLSAF